MKALLGLSAACGFFWLAGLAPASALPEDVLQQEYKNCMGGETDPQRGQYCACVRDGMKDWTVEESLEVAKQIQGSQATPDKIAALAKSCIDKILH